jgi:hypothetical protein
LVDTPADSAGAAIQTAADSAASRVDPQITFRRTLIPVKESAGPDGLLSRGAV